MSVLYSRKIMNYIGKWESIFLMLRLSSYLLGGINYYKWVFKMGGYLKVHIANVWLCQRVSVKTLDLQFWEQSYPEETLAYPDNEVLLSQQQNSNQ